MKLLLLAGLALALVANASPKADWSGQDAKAIDAIRNTISLYPLALDSKNFDDLSNIFYENLQANYAGLPFFPNVSSLADYLEGVLARVQTHHMLGTQVIDLDGDQEATATTYIQANHFGVGNSTGKIYVLYGRYLDRLRRGDDGVWKIYERNATREGSPQGDISIFR
ncbi:MAG: hypothetical protein M1832_003787 [Thelocarpon impressellum]|nr:MAG: hypothetical protein M1832_003787 [Thelocarpon impressellum]